MQAAYPESVQSPAFHPDVHVKPQRLRQDDLTEADRRWAVLMHLSSLMALLLLQMPLLFLPPLVLWLIRRERSAFNDDHGRETLNFAISLLILSLVLSITLIGIPLVLVLWVVAFINMIRGAVAASNGEYFRYPMTIRLLS